MGPIFEAVRPYLPEFCDVVDPAELMRHLRQLRSCDEVACMLC